MAKGKTVELTEVACPRCGRRFQDISAKRAEVHLRQHEVKHDIELRESV
jgi:4-hydroxy-3-methylbut-2-en-1-yl diphosphate synthase IspG/GcpE